MHNLADAVALYELRLIKRALDAEHWSRSGAARLLGMPRTTLVSKMQVHGLTDFDRSDNIKDRKDLAAILRDAIDFWQGTEARWLEIIAEIYCSGGGHEN